MLFKKKSLLRFDQKDKIKGFTLVEVLIAISIIATIAVIGSSWSGNLIRFKSAQIKIEAVDLLQKKIIEIETEYKNKVDSLPTEKQSGTFEGDRFKNYKWEWEAQEIQIPDISALVDPEGKDTLIIAVLENFRDYLNQSIKEVQVTVTHQIGKEKPFKFNVPFYLVNFDNQLTLGVTGADGLAPPTNGQSNGQNSGSTQSGGSSR
jgi:prepilin-type N-terminal cleavage/methylation domain-containing protein